ncbi:MULTISPECIES: hypothetical protein [unclassified Dehalobacter]|uniref:hypothetical protein n=1 Tax=unclassified Dehalobacter TaxID=2635733 RepID=UPI000E6C4061|nr:MULTISPECIES: hypothetical protein [unclassified Dehalobacter]RJE47970.1 hypothetical protein A7K50_00110 [Dehalobacter sp. MCB1]TCX50622.1 hypothetical protein C1I36_08705 [Dehalobacter sp. 14DCB1]TCX52134.1 hypothetical protein C1I38_09005 [Dehalobacter sp. 12DCB1]
MNYEGIANFVHECVKNPKLLTQADQQSKNIVKPTELPVIQNVFSRGKVSGGAIAIEVSPLIQWA